MGGREVKITADTNVLLRVLVEDDAEQAAAARGLLARATLVAIPVPVLCELGWVLRRGYGYSANDVAAAIEAILDSETVKTDRPAAEAGLAELRAGGDFADAAIASQGLAIGGTVFASFDRGAVARLRTRSLEAADPADLAPGAHPFGGFHDPDRPV